MVKAKDVWDILCNEFDYRFFSGVAHSKFKLLYKTMDSSMMHYVPAVDEVSALGIVSGARIAGHKSGIIIDSKFASDIIRVLEFNSKFKIPVLIITGDDNDIITFKKRIKTLTDVKKFMSKLDDGLKPGLMILGEGDLK